MKIRLLILVSTALLLLACKPDNWEVVTNSLTVSPPEDVIIGDNEERVYNCGVGGDVIYMTPQRSLASAETVQWEVGGELEASITPSAGFLVELKAELGVELQGKYGKSFEVSQHVGNGWQLPARPGEWLAYTIRWSEIWEPGTILITNGRVQKPVGYRYRKAIKTEIVDKQLLNCNTLTVVPTLTAVPEATTAPAVPVDPTVTPASIAEFQLIIQGLGFAPDSMTNPAQRRRAALLAAEMDAKRNLAVWLTGEEIAAVTVVENGQVTVDEIRRKVSAYLVGVSILREEYDEVSGEAVVEIAPLYDGEK